MEKVYCERANNRLEFWTYSDGQRVYINEREARRLNRQGVPIINLGVCA